MTLVILSQVDTQKHRCFRQTKMESGYHLLNLEGDHRHFRSTDLGRKELIVFVIWSGFGISSDHQIVVVPRGRLPIACNFQILCYSGTNYSVIEHKLLAIVWAVNHFRNHLFGRKFNLCSEDGLHTLHSELRKSFGNLEKYVYKSFESHEKRMNSFQGCPKINKILRNIPREISEKYH